MQIQSKVPPETNQVNCPFCGKTCSIVYKKPFWVLDKACNHADMAVDAGNLEIAIHFVGK